MRPPLFHRRLLAPALLLCACAPAFAVGTLAQSLSAAAPSANPRVIDLAVRAQDCAVRSGEPTPERLAVIDYSRPSTEPRLWVFDLARQKLLFEELVAHGRNSGDNLARNFSNAPGSLESSLGLFRTLGTYSGRNGYSLRMDGLEPGVNDRALERALVIHGAPYVSAATARRMGRLGRSWGCPAVRPAVAQRLIDTLKGGQMVFSYYPDARWLHASPYLRCEGEPAAVAAAAPHASGRGAAAR
ncbi:MAG: murein L,D-transpeptidase catalytic domain family protein [Mizugakiibacter sp.]|uniref:murein L,D-transpeptidase catalytic domain family protein n=1 Tax=Mizugakiibacter sp. TaxID=1972610 RepID=UPI0031C611D0|nr:murein L,D-transpeptidase catalytic domain family protein [Xanthomonadaceae bacterium]